MTMPTNNPDGRPDGDANARIPCPNCGREVGNLPVHMRGCDGETDV